MGFVGSFYLPVVSLKLQLDHEYLWLTRFFYSWLFLQLRNDLILVQMYIFARRVTIKLNGFQDVNNYEGVNYSFTTIMLLKFLNAIIKLNRQSMWYSFSKLSFQATFQRIYNATQMT